MNAAPAIHRPFTARESGLARIVRAASTMPPADARKVLAFAFSEVICMGKRQPGAPQSPRDRALAKRHHDLRQPVIAGFQTAVQAELAKASRAMLRGLKAEFTAKQRSGEGKAGGPSAILSSAASPFASSLLRGENPPIVAGLGLDVLFDFARWRDGLLATVSDELTHALDVAGTQLFEELGRDDVWTMPDPRAVKFLDQRKNFIRDAADSFHAELKGIMQDAIAQGKGQPETIRDITTRFADVDQATAKVWASTEIAAAYGEARQQGLIEAGIAFKRWVCSFDNSRATHIAAHEDERNQRVPVGESFHVGKDLLVFPGDSEHGSPEEVINCHCLAIAVSEHEDPNGGSGDGLTKYEREGLFP